jgi:hypothetical protein
MTTGICSECGGKHYARGLCRSHYRRSRRNDPLPDSAAWSDRFWSKVDKTTDDTCWQWIGATNEHGYGHLDLNGSPHYAHRLSVLLATGIEYVEVDHRCRNTGCVNPRHLRPVTPKQNAEHQHPTRRKSISGVRGVYPNRRGWQARVKHNGQQICLGTYATIEQAASIAQAARLRLFTHNDLDRAS